MKLWGALSPAIALCLLVAACSGRTPAKLKGAVLDSPHPAPDFTLTDQHGSVFHLADARGKVVVLSFIYTHCTDICPFEALKIKAALPLLGSDAGRAVFVAVTTDPERDTQGVVADYSREAGLFDAWHFVTGPLDAVRQVWSDYGIGVRSESKDESKDGGNASHDAGREESPSQGLSKDDLEIAGRIIDRFGGGYEVAHTAPYWFIDTEGRLRAIMDADVLPSDIADNVRALLRGR
jgi:protein SCO1/2